MSRTFNCFTIIISIFCVANGLFASHFNGRKGSRSVVHKDQCIQVPYGFLIKKRKYNPLDPENPYEGTLCLDRNSLNELTAQIEQIYVQIMNENRRVDELGLDCILYQLSKKGEQPLFDYLKKNRIKLDRASRDALVNHRRLILDEYKVLQAQRIFEEQMRRLGGNNSFTTITICRLKKYGIRKCYSFGSSSIIRAYFASLYSDR